MNTLPTASPAQALAISPEALEIANTYLQCQNLNKTAQDLGLAPDMVSEILDRREVRAYIDNVFLDQGFNNRFLMREVMDTIIRKKLQELDEAEIGSSKDIMDILALSHKMTMDALDRQIQLEKIRNPQVKTQTNVQINELGSDGTKYGALLQKLIGAGN